MKVYVITRAELMHPERYVTVKATKKEAVKVIRGEYPNARLDIMSTNSTESYTCKNRDGSYELMFIREETI